MNRILAEKAAEILKGLANPTRLRIAELLKEGELCVGELAAALGMKESIVSQQLSKMKNKGILSSRRYGCKVFYCLTDKKMINDLLDCMNKDS